MSQEAKYDEKLVIRLDRQTMEWLKDQAKEKKIGVSPLVRMIIEEARKQKGKK